MREETGLIVQPGPLVGAVERPGPGGSVLDIRDYAATVTGGTLAAGDDAADARWVAAADVARLALTTGLADALTAWGVLAERSTAPTPPWPGPPSAGAPIPGHGSAEAAFLAASLKSSHPVQRQ